ncbi:MAG TPA: HD domain-containing protein [Methanofollis liminatans]|uniref:HD domain-containing protein n=1 Tax=Methanofollis liminatans TaxID=2201 RepID=A0A831M269_9EURY|nr:HD domain-containing protein [Methanofollis liminatans]
MPNTEIETILAYVEASFRQSGAHGLDHVLRVTRLCEEIGLVEGADMRVLTPAALFHDIARPLEEESGVLHEEEGARIAEEYLRSIGYDAGRIPAIAHAIRTHRYSTGANPETLEARILSDADKLDAMGAVGIARAFLQAGERGGGIEDADRHIHEKLLNLSALISTPAAAAIAERRHALLQRFADALEEETGLTSPAGPPVQSSRNTSSPRT